MRPRITHQPKNQSNHRRVRIVSAAALLFVCGVSNAPSTASASGFQTVSAVSSAALRERAAAEGSVRVIVQLADPAVPWWARALDLERTARRWDIAEEQEEVLADLAGASASSPTGVRRFRDAPFMALDADSSLLAALERSDRVLSIEEDRLLAPFLNQSIPVIGADQAVDAGHDGTGWAVAVIDTGVDASHEFLSGRVVAEACFSANGSCPNGSSAQIGAGAGTNCDYTTSCFHGTHVAGIAAGSVSFLTGVAPGASIISIQVFSRFTGSLCDSSGTDPCALAFTSDIVAALEHVDALRATHDIAAANMSLGGGDWDSQASCDAANPTLKSAIDTLRAAGVASVVASGNNGYVDAMGAPACISSAVSVGATDDSDHIASFTNSADFLALFAPGVSIASSVPLALLGFDYGIASGTSMATPHVAGAWAIARQVDGEASVDAILSAFQNTGLAILDENGVTASRISVPDAIALLGAAGLAGCIDDADGDGVCDDADNCSLKANADQIDTDGNGYGNACDADYDNDGSVTGSDFVALRASFGSSLGDPEYDAAIDSDGNDQVGPEDFLFLRGAFRLPLGPSGLSCAGTIPCSGS